MLLKTYSSGNFSVELFDVLDSTNNYLKLRALSGSDMLAAVALRQTAGKGSRGRSFYSAGNGLYLSALIKNIPLALSHLITPAAAVAVADSLEACGSEYAGIKWVNDIYIRGKKVCGILTESKASGDVLDWAVLGIGINLTEPEGGFPVDIKSRAGAAFVSPPPGISEALAGEILKRLETLPSALESRSFLEEYRARSVIIGREITVFDGKEEYPARALSIDDDCRLTADTPNGPRSLFTGEVSVRI